MPPLNALRAFEAAARHESFVSAASELGVTPGAIAQQVKVLEAWAGCSLFERSAHGVRLTAKGRSVRPKLGFAFDALGSAGQVLRRPSGRRQLRIAALPGVAQLWLSPRLPALRRRFPELVLSVSHRREAPLLQRESFDVALFFIESKRDGETARLLAEDSTFPVCAPSVARRLSRIEDLARETLLHDERWAEDWERWLDYAGAPQVDPHAGPTFSLYSLALEQAIQGAGVLIGHAPLVGPALARGQLVAPFPLRRPATAHLTALIRDGHSTMDAERLLVDSLTQV